MGSYPTSPRAAFLNWCDTHSLTFQDHAADIGLSPGQVSAFQAALAAAEAAVTAQGLAKEMAKSATVDLGLKMDTLNASVAGIIRAIHTFAENTNDPGVYVTANVPPPAAPTDLPVPALCTDLTATLDGATGEITIRWKATQPAGANGTSYIVTRKILGQAEFSFVGVTGRKFFVDSTFAAGPDSVMYQVQGTRSDSVGPMSAVLLVTFGRTSGGGITITGETLGGKPIKVAA